MFTESDARKLLTYSWHNLPSEKIDEIVETAFELFEKTINANPDFKKAMEEQNPVLCNLIKRYVVSAEASRKVGSHAICFVDSNHESRDFILESLILFGYKVEERQEAGRWNLCVTWPEG